MIIFLNVITSFHTILDALAQEFQSSSPISPSSPSGQIQVAPNGKTASYAEINMRLSPMLSVESQLVHKLNIGVEEADAAAGVSRSWPSSSKTRELTVRGMAWKKSFQKLRHDPSRASSPVPGDADDGIDWEDRQDPGSEYGLSSSAWSCCRSSFALHSYLQCMSRRHDRAMEQPSGPGHLEEATH